MIERKPTHDGAQADTMKRTLQFLPLPCLVAATALALAGCNAKPAPGHPLKAFEITIRNQGPDIRQLEVDYPHASYGQDALASGADFSYLPKVMGSGPVKVSFTDSMGKPHTATGPTLTEGQRKELVITIGEDESIHFQDMTEQHN